MGVKQWVAATAGCIASITASGAQAQTFVDVFAGRSYPQNTRASITADEARADDTVVAADLHIEIERLRPTHKAAYGARLGHWFGWLGIAVDASTLDLDIKRQTLRATGNLRLDEDLFGERVTIDPGQSVSVDIPHLDVPMTGTIAALAMARYPGRAIQPYAFAGPAYLVTDTDLGGKWGLRAGGGVTVPLNRTIAIFGEYRYTGVSADVVAGQISGTARGVSATSDDIHVDLTLRSHSGVGGVRFSF